MAPQKDQDASQETRLKVVEDQLKNLQGAFQAIKSEISDLKKLVESMENRLQESSRRYVVTCPQCKITYDMLAHHYSIGLFDNMVYVKCPKCNKSLPVQGGSGGRVRAVSEEAT